MKLLGPVSGAPISHPLECRVVIGVLLLPMDQPAWSAAEPSIDGQNAVITTTLPYGTAETACTDLDSECHVPGRLFPIYSSQAEKRPIRTPRTAAPPFSAPYVRVENKKQNPGVHLPSNSTWGIRRLISETQHTNVLNNYILISSDPQIDAAIASLIKSFFKKKLHSPSNTLPPALFMVHAPR
jgi:hypothetical protein